MLTESTTAGEIDLGEVRSQWAKIDALTHTAVQVSRQRESAIISRAKIDLSQPGGHRLYSTVDRYLTAARDCDRALRSLLAHHGATQTAMWALLRTQFESAFWALWHLDPEASSGRVLRGIRSEWLDDRANQTYYREMSQDTDLEMSDEARAALNALIAVNNEDDYAAEAAAHGSQWIKPRAINMTDELPQLRLMTEYPGWGSMARSTWRDLAGLQHGSVGALLRASDQSQVEKVPGGTRLYLSPSETSFQNKAIVTANLHLAALDRYIVCHQPTQSGEPIDLRALRQQREMWRNL